jgi:hypothetical protein
MTTSSKAKRLDEVEGNLTPKGWAVRLQDEFQKTAGKNPSTKQEFLQIQKLFSAAFDALSKQAEEKIPGHRPEDIRARNIMKQGLVIEFHALKKLAGSVNEEILNRAALAGLDAALKISTLQTIVLQDAFSRTARKATEWIEDIKTSDEGDESNKLIMLDELGAYTEVSLAEKVTDSLPIGNLRLRFPTVVDNWIKAAVFLIEDLYGYQAAVKVIQDKFFDGHPVLYPPAADGLKRAIQEVEDAVHTFNEYLDIRNRLFKAEWDDEDERQDGLTSAIPGEREGLLKINLEMVASAAIRTGKDLAKEWAKKAKAEATFDIRQRDEGPEQAAEEMAVSMGWIKS